MMDWNTLYIDQSDVLTSGRSNYFRSSCRFLSLKGLESDFPVVSKSPARDSETSKSGVKSHAETRPGRSLLSRPAIYLEQQQRSHRKLVTGGIMLGQSPPFSRPVLHLNDNWGNIPFRRQIRLKDGKHRSFLALLHRLNNPTFFSDKNHTKG